MQRRPTGAFVTPYREAVHGPLAPDSEAPQWFVASNPRRRQARRLACQPLVAPPVWHAAPRPAHVGAAAPAARWRPARRLRSPLVADCARAPVLTSPPGQSPTHSQVRCPVRADLIEVWQRLPWWEQACDAWPSLVEDAKTARHELAMAAAYEEHVERPRAVAAGRGLTAFVATDER